MELQIFKNEQFGQVQLLEINNEPWFVGKEIAEILGYKNSRDALSKHVDEEDKGVAKRDTLGGSQDQVIIRDCQELRSQRPGLQQTSPQAQGHLQAGRDLVALCQVSDTQLCSAGAIFIHKQQGSSRREDANQMDHERTYLLV